MKFQRRNRVSFYTFAIPQPPRLSRVVQGLHRAEFIAEAHGWAGFAGGGIGEAGGFGGMPPISSGLGLVLTCVLVLSPRFASG